jgi:L-ascorbate metabolism protein UlaG (beta-lactamase superfamily)
MVRRTLAAFALVLALGGCSTVSKMAGRNLGALTNAPRPVPNKVTHPERVQGRLSVLWIGHATALIQIDDKFVLTDPVFTGAVGQLSKRLVEPGLAPEDLPPVDAVVISHMHFDHLSLGSLDIIEPKVKHLFVPRGGLVYIPNYTFSTDEVRTFQTYEMNGLRVTAVPVKHVGWRYGADVDWMTTSFTGWVFEYHGLTVYFGGDTAYVAENFARTRARFPNIDLALLPIAPIHPRDFMKRTHVDPMEAVQAFLDLGAKTMIPIHYDTFVNSGDEPGEPRRVLEQVMRARGLSAEQVQILEIGEQRVIIRAEPTMQSAVTLGR